MAHSNDQIYAVRSICSPLINSPVTFNSKIDTYFLADETRYISMINHYITTMSIWMGKGLHVWLSLFGSIFR